MAEDTSAAFTVTSQTAVVDYEGVASFTYSTSTDYNAIASALKELNLFKGSYTGYGQGYDLEVSATRIQALIMFIRVLGEEEAALNWTGTTPFTDIAHGSLSEHYVGYALEKGYTNGYTATLFKPDLAVTANQYMEFMLRALGYSSAANTDLSNTLARALTAGVITSGEMTACFRPTLSYGPSWSMSPTTPWRPLSAAALRLCGPSCFPPVSLPRPTPSLQILWSPAQDCGARFSSWRIL